MRTLLVLSFGLAIIALVPTQTEAQDPASVRPLSRADSAAVLIHAARELSANDEPDAAQAVLRLILDRFGDTPSAAQARIDLGLVETAQSSSSGRVELQVWSALYGLWAGLALPAAMDADGSEAYGVGLLLGGPAGFWAASAYTRANPLTTGQARAITLGGTWGTWQGWGWANVADVGEGFSCSGDVCFSDDSNGRWWAALAGGAAGIVTGSFIAKRPISPGLATTVNFGALWGSWFGLAAAGMADLDDDDDFLAAVLVGGNAGLLSSALLGRQWNLTRSRARLISIAGVLGGLAGGGIDLLIQPDDPAVGFGIPLATSIAGLVIGAQLTTGPGSSGGERGDLLNAGGLHAGGPDAGGASVPSLFSLHEGSLRLGLPLPTPERVLISGAAGDRRALTNRLTLFSLRF